MLFRLPRLHFCINSWTELLIEFIELPNPRIKARMVIPPLSKYLNLYRASLSLRSMDRLVA